MACKFNVGDVVINFEDLQFWNNVYHFNKTIRTFKKEIVVSATDRFFTTKSDIDLSKFNGFSDWREQSNVCTQEDGRAWDGGLVYVNLTTNEKNLRAHLQSLFDGALTKCDNDDAVEITKLEAEIAQKQKQVENIKAGKRGISFKREIIERDFINERIQEILNVLDN